MNETKSSNRSTIWIVGTVALLIPFGFLAFITKNNVWWSAFGVVIAIFGAVWWWLIPTLNKSRNNR